MRVFQARTDVLASFPSWDMLLRSFFGGTDISLGFLDGTVVLARFPVWAGWPCDVSMMGKIYPRGFQDGMDILVGFQDGTYCCEVCRTGQMLMRGFHIGTDINVRFPHWDRY